MSKGQTKKTREAAGNRRKLTRAEKKQIAAVIRQAKGDGKAHTAQQTIPYLAMYPDGICKVAQRKYSKSIAFEDINYQLAQADDKTAIFENWCDFLNYFDASVNVQLSFINQGSQQEQAARAIHIPPQNDDFNSIRTEYSDMLKAQLAKGNNGLVKHKYITFSIEADNPAAARARLSRIETDVLNNFKVLGVSAHPLSGYERLKVLHGVFHPAGEPFSFSYDWLTPTGLTTKDFIAPSSFKFGEGRYFAMGKKTGAVSFLEILAPELNDRILADMLDLETGVIVNLHIKSIDQSEAIKTIKRKITDLDKMKIEEQKKAVRSGYDMDIIPSDLATFGNEAKNLLQDLQSRNERMFLLTFLVVNMADTKRKLENDIFAAAGIAQKYNCALTRLDYQQEAGLMSSIPLGENLIPIQRGLTTSSTAIFIPFITQELFQTGAALYYGLNALSNNMILCDRKQLKNPNGLIFENPAATVTEHDTTPPKPHNEASLLSAMERAGSEDTDPDAERKGLGTPATRAAVIEKLVKGGFVERKGKQLLPTKDGINLVCVLPDTLTSPQLTAEWENNLTQIAKGKADPAAFMEGIEDMARELVKTYPFLSDDKAQMFKPEREALGSCPRCGSPVYEGKKNYYCSNKECIFTMWKNDRFFEERKVTFTPKIAAALLKSGRVNVKKLYSPKTGKTYDGTIVLADTGGKYVNYRVELPKKK